MLRPAIVTLTYQGPVPFYVDCIANLLSSWTFAHRRCLPFRVIKGGDPAFQSWMAVREMRKHEDTDGLLFIEHDHAFLLEDAEKLLLQATRVPEAIVGGFYYQRMTDDLVGTFYGGPENPESLGDLIRCTHVGLGFCWVPWSVFDKVPEPWFDPKWRRNEDGSWSRDSHDTAFCRDALAVGIRIYGVVLPNLLHQHDVPPRGVKVKA